MNKNSSLLLIVEGAKAEVNLIEKMFEIYDINVSDKQIYSYNTNIYDIYDKIFKDSLNELDTLDFLLTLKEKGANKEQSEVLLDREYSDILLIFDYEPQDPRFDVDKILIMMKYFVESTDKGKLYINYPSIESYKHFKSIPDEQYLSRFCHIEELTKFGKSRYKEIVGIESVISDLRKYDKKLFNYLICENIKKARYIKNQEVIEDVVNSFFQIDDLELLKIINQKFQKEQLVPVLNTSMFFVCEYDIRLIL